MTSAYDTLKDWLADDKLERDKKQPDPREHTPGPKPPANKDIQNTLNAMALGTTPLPIVGDALGLLADAFMYATKPEERTLGNAALTGIGLLPFVPGTIARATKVQEAALGTKMINEPDITTKEGATKLWRYGRDTFNEGLFVDKFGNLKREIPDTNVKFKSDNWWEDVQGEEGVKELWAKNLFDIIDHPNLQKLKDSPLKSDVELYARLNRERPIYLFLDPKKTYPTGHYDDYTGEIILEAKNEMDLLESLMHEIGHDIQDFQKLPGGDSSSRIQRKLSEPKNILQPETIVKTAKQYEAMLKSGTEIEYKDLLSRLLYMNKLGEVESRAVSNRLMSIQNFEQKKNSIMQYLPSFMQDKSGDELAKLYLDSKPFPQSYDVEEDLIYDVLFRGDTN